MKRSLKNTFFLVAALSLSGAAAAQQPVPPVGTVLEDGSIYAGTSDITKKSLCARPRDEERAEPHPGRDKGVLSFREANRALGTQPREVDRRILWRFPYVQEAWQIWQNKDVGAFKGTFHESGKDPYYITNERSDQGLGRSAEELAERGQTSRDEQYTLRFVDGTYASLPLNYGFRVRAVRSPCATLKPRENK